MVLRRVGTPKKIVSETEPAYEERAVWVEVDSSGNIINQYVGFFDEWILIDTNANFPVHFDFLQSSQPALDAGKSWLEVTSFVTNTIDTPTTGSNIYEFDISSTDDVFNVNSVTVLGNLSSTSRGPVTITDSGSATVDPQGTRVEDATVTFTGVDNSYTREYSGTSTETQSIVTSGNTIENAEITYSASDSTYSDSGLGQTFTLPPDAPSAAYRFEFRWDNLFSSENVDWAININGNEAFQGSTSVDGSNNDYTTGVIDVPKYFDVTAGPGDTIEMTISAPDGNYKLVEVSASEPASGDLTVTTDAGDGTTVSISSGQSTAPISLSASASEYTISQTGTPIDSYSLSYQDIDRTTDPSLTVDGETVSHTGTLADGETVTKTLSGLTPGSYTADVSVSGPASTTVNWTDITETVDPTISVNGNTAGYNGVLTSGDSVNLDIEKSWLISGTNTLELINGSPASLILEYDEVDTSGQTTVRLYFSDGNNWYEL